ncbi:MAG: hypothetical protein A2163_07990 [Actinobacteria bacterium RBG_13_35_12]|nr:MAG: hypothetical protein A2163_07990 [Actinobacteria bacterium RBG_13_35_12]
MPPLSRGAKRLVDSTEGKSKKENVISVSYIKTADYVIEQIVKDTMSRKIEAIAGLAGGAGTYFRTWFIQYFLKSKTEHWEERDDIEIDNCNFIPVESHLFEGDDAVLIFPSGLKEYESDTQLIKEIKEFINDYLQVPKKYENIIAYFALFTWIADHFPFTCYVHFVGLTGSGKSRGIDVMSQIVYKAIRGSGSITPSSIFRLTSQFQGTLLLNEFEMTKDDSNSEKVQILKAGSENFAAFRVEKVEGSKKLQVEKFTLKGPKIIAGEHPIENAALESRIITIPMIKKTRRLPLIMSKKFSERGEELRNKLLLWRFRHIGKINLEDIEYGFSELEAFDSRIQQVITPIYYLADEATRKEILSYIKQQEEEIHLARREELDGKVFQAIYENLVDNKVLFSTITQQFNPEYTPRKISNVIRKELSLQIKEEGHDKIKYVHLTENQLKRLKAHYGYTEKNNETLRDVPASPAPPADKYNNNNHNNNKIDQTISDQFLDDIKKELPF